MPILEGKVDFGWNRLDDVTEKIKQIKILIKIALVVLDLAQSVFCPGRDVCDRCFLKYGWRERSGFGCLVMDG